ncbi:MAG: M15 family metallopeptidase [Bacteroidaceae bacterium]|nr:M15 family metallopeptidase [Bacteroidaceae bacterium]
MKLTCALLFLTLYSCQLHARQDITVMPEDSITQPQPSVEPLHELSHTALYLDSLGYVNVMEQDSSIRVSLMYAREDNFTGKLLYQDLKEAYLHPDAIAPLLRAQQLLRQRHPDYSLIIFDAARPMHVQQQMWEVVKGTRQQNYVSNPAHGGGLHNYGLAVDISIANAEGDTIPMGTKVDHLGREANTDYTAISQEALQNRRLLIQVMRQAGFRSLPTEWWHFNLVSRQTAKEKYRVIP